MSDADESAPLLVDYTNHAGERRLRTVRPLGKLWFGETPWHAGRQWFLSVLDTERGVYRDLALTGIHGFKQEGGA